MEYTQITLDDWMSMKERLKKDLIGVQESFVRIGYTLRKIEEQELFKQDSYETIAEFAKAEYGLSASTVSRFMSINRKYSVDGYSDQLRPEFAQLGSSKLSEMLSLPDGDLEMIQPEATREGIRELKQFNKAEPAAGVADDIRELIEKFFETNQEALNDLYGSEAYATGEVDKLVDIVNPSGNKTFKKGLYFLMMYEHEIKIKKFGANPQSMPWAEFFSITQEIFDEAAAGSKTWENYFGGGEDESVPEQGEAQQQDNPEDESADEQEESKKVANDADKEGEEREDGKAEDDAAGKESSKGYGESPGAGASTEPAGEESQGEEIAPAQKTAEILEETAFTEAELSADTTNENTQKLPEEESEASDTELEATQTSQITTIMTRKEYLDGLTPYGAADYLSRQMKEGDILELFSSVTKLLEWLTIEVDERGETIE